MGSGTWDQRILPAARGVAALWAAPTLGGLSLLAGSFLGSCRPAAEAEAGPPAMFRGGADRLGVVGAARYPAYGGIQWVAETGGPVRSSPVVHAGAVYVGSADGRLHAFDRRSGATRWSFEADGPVDSSPAVTADLVVFASRRGTVFALRPATGELVWRRTTGPDLPLAWGHESGDFFTASPALIGATAVIGAGDGKVYALDLANGSVRWTFATGGRVRSSPAVAGGTVYAGSMDGRLYALGLEDGALRWRFETAGARLDSGDFGFDRRTIQSSPAVAGGRVYVGSRDGHLYAIDAASGRLVWRFDHDVSWVITSPAVAEGVVYAGSSDAAFVQAVDARTGAERWRVPTARSVWASPIVVGDQVVFAVTNGTLLGLDRRNGAERWRFQTFDGTHSSPTVADGILYVGDMGGRVYALRGAEEPLRRAVFWDTTLSDRANRPGGDGVRDFLVARGYELLDAGALGAFLAERVTDRAPSVIVFAVDVLPESAVEARAGVTLFRRYLEAGGKVVWLGWPPLIWPADPATGERVYADIDRAATAELLGVDHAPANFDRFAARPTAAGERWGLTRWWVASWSAAPDERTTALALDENGAAPAWVHSYGGPPGTGFVRYDGPIDGSDRVVVARLAEHRPVPEVGSDGDPEAIGRW